MSAEARCLFCGEAHTEPNHILRCNGRQGEVEALYGRMGDVPYETTSDTSAGAAAALTDDDRNRLEQLVYGAIAGEPHTCDEVEAITGLAHQTASARIRGLVLRDQIFDSGVRRKTRRNRMAVVWAARRQQVAS